MMDATASVQHLADQLGVTVNWASLHQHLSSAPVMQFVAYAARVAYATSVHQLHDERIGQALNAAAGSAGTTDTDLPALLHAISIDQNEIRDQAIAAAWTLLGDLLRLGVVR